MTENKNPLQIEVEGRQSLVHLGSLDSFDITEGGREAAKMILNYLSTGQEKHLTRAIEIYESLIPNENFGGEYTALEWLCRYWLSEEKEQKKMLQHPLIISFLELLTDNDCDNLKIYLWYKYHIKEYDKDSDNTELKKRMRYLEDFILFNNPDRERWEKTRENLEKVGLTEGMRVADVGAGPGYFTFKFADIVGKTGKVYASETNPRHLEFLRDFVSRNDISNVEVVESSFNGIGLPEDVRVDVVYMCSLYHNVYAAFTDAERDEFVATIRTALEKNGNKLVIVDNDLVTDENLPYHGPYINNDLIISQLWHYGFELEDTFQFTPQRYVLVFKMTDVPKEMPPELEELDDTKMLVTSPVSVVRYRIIGTSTSGYTCRGKVWGRLFHEGLVENDPDKLRQAYDGFNQLWPLERIGDDYTAFLWLIDYRLAEPAVQKTMTQDLLTNKWAKFWCDNDYENLKTYLYYKFDLAVPNDPNASIDVNYEYAGTEFSIGRLNKWNEYMIFNNPNRVLWEHTDEMLEFCDIKPGECIADIGCGGGYFTWQFSKAVGKKGRVVATEINQGALSYLREFVHEHKIKNIKPLIARMNDACLRGNSVDSVYMCSAYHAVYITNIEFVKDMFIESVRRALKKNGRLIIVDNAVTEPGTPPYYGPGIRPELIISQLSHYGFKLEKRWDGTAQRFALIFRKDNDFVMPKIKFPDPMKRKRRGGKKDEKQRLQQILRPKYERPSPLRRAQHAPGPEDDRRNDN